MAEKFATVDDYVGSFPEDVRAVLGEIRRAMHGAAPGAQETISYQIPTLTLHGRSLVYFAAWKHHIAVYPVPLADDSFEQELAPYRAARSTLRFPLRRPIPYDLIGRVTELLVAQRATPS